MSEQTSEHPTTITAEQIDEMNALICLMNDKIKSLTESNETLRAFNSKLIKEIIELRNKK